MIIEFFGPPGAGKTTVAKSIAARLMEHEHDVLLISSYRPAETKRSLSGGPMRDAWQRLSRAVGETTQLLGSGALQDGEAAVTHSLLRSMPTRHVVWKLRMYQYLVRLASHWRAAAAAPRITLFDQGFVQAVYSLAVLTGRADRSALDTALRLVPMPDLLIRLDLPPDLVAARLEARRRRHGRLERLLEVSPAANIASLPILATIDDVLRQRGVPVVRVETEQDWPLDTMFQTIETTIQSTRPVALEVAA